MYKIDFQKQKETLKIESFDFILKVVTKSGKSLEEILNYIKSVKGVSLTRTSVVLSTNKCEVCLLPDEI